LSDELQQFVEAKVTQGHFSSASEYIVALLDAAKHKRSDLEAALIEGLESGPAEEWSDEEWQKIKQRVKLRHQKG
jgi:putative addiction module CopG family antidote